MSKADAKFALDEWSLLTKGSRYTPAKIDLADHIATMSNRPNDPLFDSSAIPLVTASHGA